jgi:uncharacterized membrane protein required for colicin V production
MEVNFFDLINIVIVGLSICFGIYKGFIKSIISMVSFFMLGMSTILIFTILGPYVSVYIEKPIIANLVTILSSFLTSLVITSVIYAKFMDFIKDIRGGAIDRLLGIFFGFVRGMLASVLLFCVIVFFVAEDFMEYKTFRDFANDIDPDHFPSWMSDGITYKVILGTTTAAISLIPSQYIDKIMDIEFVRIDKTKGVSDTLKLKPKHKVIHEDESEYFGNS